MPPFPGIVSERNSVRIQNISSTRILKVFLWRYKLKNPKKEMERKLVMVNPILQVTSPEKVTAIIEVPPQGTLISMNPKQKCYVYPGAGMESFSCEGEFAYEYQYNRIVDPLPHEWVEQYLEPNSFSKYVLFTLVPAEGRHLQHLYFAVSDIPDFGQEGWAYIEIEAEDLIFLFLQASRMQRLQRFDLGKNGIMDLFDVLSDLYALRVAHIDATYIESLSRVFRRCRRLEEVWLKDTSNVLDFSYMFFECVSLRRVHGLDTTGALIIDGIFGYCSNLQNPPNLELHKVESANAALMGCESLERAPKWNLTNVSFCHRLFAECFKLKDISRLELNPQCEDLREMFRDCHNLHEVNLQALHERAQLDGLFSGCRSLRQARLTLNPHNITLRDTQRTQTMFKNCVSLYRMEIDYEEEIKNERNEALSG